MGDGGLRIAEAAAATRATLVWTPANDDTPAGWLLEVIGKSNKQRYVPISDASIDALRAHWRDRGEDLDVAAGLKPPGLPLVVPLVIPPTPRAREKFGEPVASREGGATPRHAAPPCAPRAGSGNGRSRSCSRRC
ncbi:hypothetical protein WT25_16880 [Burkholderia territorii]|nr:hypothetical protein WT25_16880 [Burkholderia territorii]